MSEQPTLSQLKRWRILQEQLKHVSVEKLVEEHPELIPEIEQSLNHLQKIQRTLTLQPAPLQDLHDVETVDPGEKAVEGGTVGEGEGVLVAGNSAATGIPGYEIVKELGRGGMGVVYQAWQPALKRTVALKMILSGGHASESQLQRFRTEAEAVARLQHPNVVQIYQIDDHEGLPFFSLEFCSGGSLNEKLDGTPWKDHSSAKMMETLARGMHVAHKADVVHRDLKPHNVLLDENGTPKITDFGLAKKLDEGDGVTKTESVMGTPAYMAPEQARGKTKNVGPAADVYALGAMLYELLTGRPPFKAASAWDTIALVINKEPVAPRELNPKVSRDLETICLKCLQKDPARRYVSAEGLAEDLQRFQEGRPIEARPVGRWEKAGKWVKRNPLVATLMALVMVGALVASMFGIIANNRANLAKAETVRANQGERDAKANEARANAARSEVAKKNQDIEKKNQDLKEQKQALLEGLAQSYCRAFTSERGLRLASLPLNDAEGEALIALMTTRDDDLRIQFVKEAMKSAVKTRQLRHRAKEALQATVGLNSRRRATVEDVLLRAMNKKNVTQDRRTDLALIAAELGNLKPETGRMVADALSLALSKTGPRSYAVNQFLSEGLTSVVSSMGPNDTAQVAATLVRVMSSTDHTGLKYLAQSLASVVTRMEEKEAAETCVRAGNVFIREMRQNNSYIVRRDLAKGLALLVERMPPEDAAKSLSQAMSLVAMSNNQNPPVLQSLAQSLVSVAGKMKPREAVATLTQAMHRTTDFAALRSLAQGFSSVAQQMNPQEVAQGELILRQALGMTTNLRARASFAQGLASFAKRMEPGKGAVALIRALMDTKNSPAFHSLSQGLASVAPHLEPGMAAQAAGTLTRAVSNTTDPYQRKTLAQGLVLMAARMEVKAAADTLRQTMAQISDPNALKPLAEGVASVSRRMEPGRAAQACSAAAEILIRAINKAPHPQTLQALSQTLVTLAERMEATKSAQACSRAAAVLVQAMGKPNEISLQPRLAQGLASLSQWMEPKEATKVCSQASANLLKAMSSTTAPKTLQSLAKGLASLAERWESSEASPFLLQGTTLLVKAMMVTKNLGAAVDIGAALDDLAEQMESRDAVQAVSLFVQAMSEARVASKMMNLAHRIASVAPRMKPEHAAQAAELVVQGIGKFSNSLLEECLGEGLASIAERMEVNEAAALHLRIMKMPTNYSARKALAQSMDSVAARMQSKDAEQACAQVASLLAMEITKEKSRSGSLYLVQSLTLMTKRMEPKAALSVLRKTLGNIRDSRQPYLLTEGFASAAERLQPNDAVATLTQALSSAVEQNGGRLAKSLASVAERLEPREAAIALTKAMSNTPSFSALLVLEPRLVPIVKQIEPQDAAPLAATLTKTLLNRIEKSSYYEVKPLTKAFVALARQMKPGDGARACSHVAARLVHQMKRATGDAEKQFLAQALGLVAVPMADAEAAEICSVAATTLTNAMGQAKRSVDLKGLSLGLAAVAARMEPEQASQVCFHTVTLLKRSMSKTADRSSTKYLVEGVAAVAARMEPTRAAATLLEIISTLRPSTERQLLEQSLTTLLTGVDDPRSAPRIVTASVGDLVCNPLKITSLSILHPTLKPLPLRLPPAQLVEILKLYSCTRQTKRLLLYQLEQHYDQRFANQWDFVEYAKKQDLPAKHDFDFNSPPKFLPLTNSTAKDHARQ